MRSSEGERLPDPEALFCALVVAPQSFSRNRFFSWFEVPSLADARRRARRVRGVLDQLVGKGHGRAEIVGEQVLGDGQVLLHYRVDELSFQRTIALTPLEASTLRYGLHRARGLPVSEEDRSLVLGCLRRLHDALGGLPEELQAELDSQS